MISRERYFRDANPEELNWWREPLTRFSPQTVAEFEKQAEYAVSLINDFAPEKPSVLVVGYGFGRETKILKDKIPQAEVFALDINFRLLRQNKTQMAEFLTARAQQIPLPSEFVDAGLCLETLSHIDDSYKALEEMFRVIKANGILVFNLGAVDSPVPVNLVKSIYSTEGLKGVLKRLLPGKDNPVLRTKYLSLSASLEMIDRLTSGKGGEIIDFKRYLAKRALLVAVRKTGQT